MFFVGQAKMKMENTQKQKVKAKAKVKVKVAWQRRRKWKPCKRELTCDILRPVERMLLKQEGAKGAGVRAANGQEGKRESEEAKLHSSKR